MTCTEIETLELEELMQKLRDKGCDELVDGFLENDQCLYTKSGRLNKSAVCRTLGWRLKRLTEEFARARDILAQEYDD